MDCKTTEKQILPFLEGTLTDEEVTDFIAHVRRCPSCYNELETYFTIHTVLRDLDTDKISSYDVQKMLEEEFLRKETEIRRRKRKKTLGYVSIAVGILLLIILVSAILFPYFYVEIFYDIANFFTELGGAA